MQPAACPKCKGQMYLRQRQGDRAFAEVCACTRECRRCNGSGFVYQTREETFSARVGPKQYEVVAPCPCKVLEKRVVRFADAGIPGVLATADFETYRPSNEAQDRAKKVAMTFAVSYRREQPPKGFVLAGPCGTGKTHLLVSVLSHLVLEAGANAKYVEISLLYATIRRGFNEQKSGGEIIGPLSEVEVLAIDELGKGRGSPFEMETLDELIARRYNAGRTTLFASNYSLEPEKKSVRHASGYTKSEDVKSTAKDSDLLRDRVGERIYSRLCEMSEFVELPATTPDHRRTRQEMDPHGPQRGQPRTRRAGE